MSCSQVLLSQQSTSLREDNHPAPQSTLPGREATSAPRNIVPRKRKANSEVEQIHPPAPCTPVRIHYEEPAVSLEQSTPSSNTGSRRPVKAFKEDGDKENATGLERFNQVNLTCSQECSQEFTKILEEENAIRVAAEEGSDYAIRMRAEREFDDAGDLLEELYAGQDALNGSEIEEEQNLDDGMLDYLNQAYLEVLQDEETVRLQAEGRTQENVVSEPDDSLHEELWPDMLEAEEYDHRGEDDTLELYDISRTYDYIGPRTRWDIYFESKIRSTEADLENRTYQKGLCWECRTIRWFMLTRTTLSERRSILKVQQSPLKLQESRCNFCKLLGEMGSAGMIQADSRDGTLEFEVFALPSYEEDTKRISISVDGKKDQSLMTIHSTIDQKTWRPPVIDPEAVNYSTLRRLFAHCRKHHGSSCRVKPDWHRFALKVIDCHTRKVVLIPGQYDYVALSYVWGQSPGFEANQESPVHFPVTIEDSLRVTRNLGFRYLWVDKYCIDQDNEAEKHAFIQNMDEIYSRAQLTIIAAAGDNPHHGLPGVGSRPRTTQRSVRIGHTKLVQLMRPGLEFPKSSWWKRAWTYQEGVLSRRKLVFTDHQVFYICNNMHAAESMNMHKQDHIHNPDPRSFYDPISFSEMLAPREQQGYVSYLRHISMRALSYQSDALNTCLGILKATETSHIWGVPFDDPYLDTTMALCWRHDVTTSRRSNFPSWSWTGWIGGVSFQNSVATHNFINIHLGGEDRGWKTIPDYMCSSKAGVVGGESTAPRRLRLSGRILSAAILKDQWPEDIADFGTGAVVHDDERPRPRFSLKIGGTIVEAVLYMDEDVKSAESLHDVLAMGVQIGGDECCISALLLKPCDDVYTRVGMLQLSCEYLTCKHRRPAKHMFWEREAQLWTIVVA